MIPSAFDYARPATVEDAVGLLHENAKIIAGGQSLLPVLRLRMAAPSLLIDLAGIAGLRGVRTEGEELVIGAMTSYYEVATHSLVLQSAPLLAKAVLTVGDRQVRHRGTIGGSLAHADPGGDLPAVALALDATMVVADADGRRDVAAKDFFIDMFTTDIRPTEILVEVRIPKLDGWGAHYAKVTRTAQSWATVAVAACVRRDNGSLTEARVALTNMGPGPVRAVGVEAAIAAGDGIESAASHAAEGTSPPTDTTASAQYRTHLARVLTRRALTAASGY
jgi:carbon-monoxide dehydrogenase medium subunit